MFNHSVTRRPVSVAAALAVVATFAMPVSADVELDPEMVNLVIESRYQKAGSQATASERAAAEDELQNIYAITDLPRAEELASMGRVAAQLELNRRALLFQAVVNDYMRNNPASEQEIFNFYEAQMGANPPTEYKARHILVETQGEAINLIGELQGGADFSALAQQHSTGPSGESGGDLGWFTSEQMVQPFSVAVAQLEDGAFTTQPVQTQFGWHVILREDSRESTPPPLDSVRDVIKQQVEQQKFQQYMESTRNQAAE